MAAHALRGQGPARRAQRQPLGERLEQREDLERRPIYILDDGPLAPLHGQGEGPAPPREAAVLRDLVVAHERARVAGLVEHELPHDGAAAARQLPDRRRAARAPLPRDDDGRPPRRVEGLREAPAVRRERRRGRRVGRPRRRAPPQHRDPEHVHERRGQY